MSHHQLQSSAELVELRPECLKALARLQSVAAYEKGSVLFRQGQCARGVYLLQSGRAELCLEPTADRRLPLRVVGPRYLLGLSAAISNEPYDFSARLLEPADVAFIHRDQLLPYLRNDHELCFHVVQVLGCELTSVFNIMRAVRGTAVLAGRNIA